MPAYPLGDQPPTDDEVPLDSNDECMEYRFVFPPLIRFKLIDFICSFVVVVNMPPILRGQQRDSGLENMAEIDMVLIL